MIIIMNIIIIIIMRFAIGSIKHEIIRHVLYYLNRAFLYEIHEILGKVSCIIASPFPNQHCSFKR